MRLKLFTLLFTLLITPFKNTATTENKIVEFKKNDIYISLKGDNLPSKESFDDALIGYESYKQKNIIKKNIITIIDFTLSSNEKRLWVIDLDSNQVVFNTLVSHGRNTGDEYAKNFSNTNESYKSSLGFFATGEIYNGKHGVSLKLDGLEIGKNDNARKRAVVIHGADYVSEKFIKQHKRLGRSLGCPALPTELSSNIIKYIKDKSCLFIYYK